MACGGAHETTVHRDDGLHVELSFDGAAVGDNTAFVGVKGADGAPVDADVAMHIHMPAHGHRIDDEPLTITRLAVGRYTVAPIRFEMPGEWRVHVTCTCEQGSGSVEQLVDVP